jgi:hypothetical protein
MKDRDFLIDTIQTLQEKVQELSERLDENEERNRRWMQQNRRLSQEYQDLAHQNQDLAHQIRHLNDLEALLKMREKELSDIKDSLTWRIGRLYSRIFYGTTANKLLENVLVRILKKERTAPGLGRDAKEPTPATTIQDVIQVINSREGKGVFVLTSAFEFDEFYNQRVINLTKFLSEAGYVNLYVAWRWTKNEPLVRGIGEEVYPNTFQIPVDYLFDHYSILKSLSPAKKYFVIEFPHPTFLHISMDLRTAGFKVIYEIIDEWEEFRRVNQASWFEKDYEEALVLNADVLTAVSTPLVEKFSPLRTDISLIPNGFSPGILGGYGNIGGLARKKSDRIHAGYFGYLTESWFDWDLVLETAERDSDFFLHIIGYGESQEILRKVSRYPNVKLHGKVHPSQLYSYVKDWDVAILPFKKNALSRAVDPIKVYEFLYFGLPTVVQGVDHLNRMPYVRVSSSLEEFQDEIRACAFQKRNGLISYERIEGFLNGASWDRRFSTLLSLLDKDGL